MALTRPNVYDIQDTNIALLGSDLEKRVREYAAGQENVVHWPKSRYGSFYDGDSYIVLHTHIKDPDANSLSYDLHFWLGENTTQDEAGTAAYKTVELDDHLNGRPVQYREIQNHESARFLSYFPHLICLRGGVPTGFHHITAPPPLNVRKLYRVVFSRTNTESPHFIVREVTPDAASLVEGDVYVLDKGSEIWQLNIKASVGTEKYKAMGFVQWIVGGRQGRCKATVFGAPSDGPLARVLKHRIRTDEGSAGAGTFLAEFGEDASLHATGVAAFAPVELVSRSSLLSSDVFLLDCSYDAMHSSVYIWLGAGSSLNEKRLAVEYAQRYLHEQRLRGFGSRVAVPLIRMNEGDETEEFFQALEA